MSRIVALLNRDREPVNEDTLRQLVAPLRIRDSDAPRFWTIGSAGLGYQCLQAAWAPDDLQPAVLEPGIAVCFDGRLDNRDELIRELRPDLVHEPRDLADAQLLAACYRRHGDLFAARLNGDFAFALFDMARMQLLLGRDVMGVRPLYFYASPEVLVAASEIKAILAHPGVSARPDDDVLADQLLGGNPHERRRTLYANVSRVLPGHTVIVRPHDVREIKHWDFDPQRQLRYKSLAEYAEALHELFEQAVRRRLRSRAPIAVSVSGGLDSSAILCESEILRRREANTPPVHGISRLYPEGSLADERSYLADIESMHGLQIRRLPPAPIRLTDDELMLWRAECPLFPWEDVLRSMKFARGLSCATVLDGHYGDQIMWTPAHLFELMRGLRWGKARHAFGAYSRSLTEASPAALRDEILRMLVRSLIPDWLMPPLRFIRRHVQVDDSPGWYSVALREAAYRRRQQQRRATLNAGSLQAEHCYRLAHAANVLMSFEFTNKIAAHFGLDVAYPFADRDLVAFVMAIPAEVVSAEGVFKGLYREAMRGILPETIRQRTWKADFTLLASRAAAQLGIAGLDTYLDPESLAAKYGYIELPALSRARKRYLADPGGEFELTSRQLNEFLALEPWLRMFFAKRRSGIA